MARATFKLLKCTSTNAAVETDTSKSAFFLSTDSATDLPSEAPVRLPTSGSVYSYESWYRLECTAAPTNYAENFKVYGPSFQPDDPTNKVTINIGISTSGVTPVTTVSSVATTSQHDNYYQAGNALLFDDVNETVDAITDKTRYFVVQLEVTPGAVGGDMTPVVFNFIWDEA